MFMTFSFILFCELLIVTDANLHPHEDANFTLSGNDDDGYLYKIENSLLSQGEPDVKTAKAKVKPEESFKQMLAELNSTTNDMRNENAIDMKELGKKANEANSKIQNIFQSLIEKNEEEGRRFNHSLEMLAEKKTKISPASLVEVASSADPSAPPSSSYDQAYGAINDDLQSLSDEHVAALKAMNISADPSSFLTVNEADKPESLIEEKKNHIDLEGLIHSLNPNPKSHTKAMSLEERIKAEESTANALEKKYHFTLPKWLEDIQNWAHGLGRNTSKDEPAVPPASLGQLEARKDIRPVSFGRDLLKGTTMDPEINPAANGVYDSEYDKIMAQEKIKKDVANGKLPFRPGENWKPKTFDQIMRERALKMQMGDPDPKVSTGTFYLQTEHATEQKTFKPFDFDAAKKKVDKIVSSLVQHMKPLPFRPGKDWHPKLPSRDLLEKIRENAIKQVEEGGAKDVSPMAFMQLKSDSNDTNIGSVSDNASEESLASFALVPDVNGTVSSFTQTESRHHRRRRHRRHRHRGDDDDEQSEDEENEEEDEEEQKEDKEEEEKYEDEKDKDKEESSEGSLLDAQAGTDVYSSSAQKNLVVPVPEMKAVFKKPKWKALPFSADDLIKRFQKKWESQEKPDLDEQLVPDASFLQVGQETNDVTIGEHDHKDRAEQIIEPFRNLKITPQSLLQPWSFGSPRLGLTEDNQEAEGVSPPAPEASFLEHKAKNHAEQRDTYKQKLASMSLGELTSEKEAVFAKLDAMLKADKKAASPSFLQHHSHKHHDTFKPVPIGLSFVDSSAAPSSYLEEPEDTPQISAENMGGSLADLADSLKTSEKNAPPATNEGPNFANDPSNPLKPEMNVAPISSFSSLSDPYATLKVPRDRNPFAMEGGEHNGVEGQPAALIDALPNSLEQAKNLISSTYSSPSFLQEMSENKVGVLSQKELKDVHKTFSLMDQATKKELKVTDPFKVANPAIKLLADLKRERTHRKKRLEEMDALKAKGEDPGLFSSDGFVSSFLETDAAKKKSQSSMMQAMKGMESAAKSESNAMEKVTRQFHALESQLDSVLGKHETDNLPAALKHLPVNGGVTDHHLKALEKLKNLEIKERKSDRIGSRS